MIQADPAPPPPAVAAAAATRHSDVLLITLDTTRRDYMGFLGKTPSPTPNLDALARRSIVFTDAFTPVPLTLPAHSSLMTGLDPSSHGVHDNSLYRLPKSAHTLAEFLHEDGYATGAAVASFVLDPVFALDQGFDRYSAPPHAISGQRNAHFTELPASTQVDHALRDLDLMTAAPRRPFFYWLHLFDPHNPYAPPDASPVTPLEALDPITLSKRLYAAEIAAMDREVGRLFAELGRRGLDRDLLIVIAADHGESLGDATEATHGHFLFDPTVRIPLLLHDPALEPESAHREVAAPASLIDVVPTLLARLGIDAGADHFDGIDLAPWIADPTREPPDRVLKLESWYVWLNYGFAPFEGCTHGPLKYLRSQHEELFDRTLDPRETKNLFAPDEPRANALRRALGALESSRAGLDRENAALSDADRRALVALGYAGGGGNADAPGGDWSALPDPYQKLAAYAGFDAVATAIERGDLKGAVAQLERLVEENPDSALFHEQLGMMRINLGPEQAPAAAAELKKALALDPRRARVWFALVRCGLAERDTLRATLKTARQAGAKADKDELKRLVAEERRLAATMEQQLRECLRLEPTYPDALFELGRQLAQEGDRAAQQKDLANARRRYEEVETTIATLLATLPADSPDRAELTAVRERCRARLAALASGK